MSRNPPQIILIILSTLLAGSCGPRFKSKNGDSSNVGVERNAIVGTFAANVENMQNGGFRDLCELKFNEAQLEIAKALDLRRAEIESISSQSFENDKWKVVRLGPTFALEPKFVPNPKQEWHIIRIDWRSIIDDYNEIKTQPINDGWVKLSQSVMSILRDDLDRAVDGENFFLDKDSGRTLETLSQKLDTCLANENCDRITLESAQRDFLLKNPLFSGLLLASEKEAPANALRSTLRYLNVKIQGAANRYRMRFNPGITRSAQDELTLPLIAGVFNEAKDQLANYIFGVWNSPNLKLKISWIESDPLAYAFRIVFDLGPAGRSYVTWDSQSVHLMPYVRSRTIAHEIGHVLGFRDHYYTVWNPQKCEYQRQMNDQDVMSNSSLGSATVEEWQQIEANYPFAK